MQNYFTMLNVDPSRLAVLLVSCIVLLFAFLAPCQSGASTRNMTNQFWPESLREIRREKPDILIFPHPGHGLSLVIQPRLQPWSKSLLPASGSVQAVIVTEHRGQFEQQAEAGLGILTPDMIDHHL